MKKVFPLLALGLLFALNTKAQYVAIPDPYFKLWLHDHGYSSCMNATLELDTTCGLLLNADTLICTQTQAQNLYGIQFFKNLKYLDCSSNFFSPFPGPLPASLRYLDCSSNYTLGALPHLPSGLKTLKCGICGLTALTHIPDSLEYLNCYGNYISNIDTLPASIRTLECYNMSTLHQINHLPDSLQYLNCSFDSLLSIQYLPDGLKEVYCSYNFLTQLPVLPSGLKVLACAYNRLPVLPAFPDSLQFMYCQFNQLPSIDSLNDQLINLYCSNNQIHSIGALPATLLVLDCSVNLLDTLPQLPDSLQQLMCSYNSISNFSMLPVHLTGLWGDHNLLTALPELPDSMELLFCSNNPLLKCLPFIKRIVQLDFRYTAITCVPDYGDVTYSNPWIDTIPLCNTVNNTNGCLVINGVNEVAQSLLVIYPNPATSQLFIQANAAQVLEINIYNVAGTLVSHLKQPQTDGIDISPLSQGVYVAEVKTQEGVGRKRWVKM